MIGATFRPLGKVEITYGKIVIISEGDFSMTILIKPIIF